MTKQSQVLIIYGYHPKETFAVGVGKLLLKDIENTKTKVVRYEGKPDKNSSYNLRRFIEKFWPLLPVVLHSDNHFDSKLNPDLDAVIVYYAKSGQEKKKILKLLFDLVFKYNKSRVSVICDVVLTHTAKQSLVEVELNPKIRLKKS